ncbi:hypothetical protein BLNAU_1163 [Blattamonas nauphoetae]|uniref:Uncharacterized protein n=1 Tax=Blattamonas nauphoetae TaxID=2049346 RepID=A0ABQ9YJZ0_9EUKA|nr:hypothetical protein BLNAU_1163 [Blattamonas nauphoetae]
MSAFDRSTTTSLEKTCSDCSPFMNWIEEKHESYEEKAVVFQSLVTTVKSQPALDDSLEAKAVKFLKSVRLSHSELSEVFLNNFASFSDESLRNFTQSFVVLISSAGQIIMTAAMDMLTTMIHNCSEKDCLALVKVDLIPQLIITLNPQSLSFAEAVDIHHYLLIIIWNTLRLSNPFELSQLQIEDCDDQQAVRETIFQQVLVPSEDYIWHLCVNRISTIDREPSRYFLLLLARILEISPYHQPTMDLGQYF